MNCQTSKEYISQFLDNELPKELLQALFQHLGECEECRNFFVQTKTIHDDVKKMAYLPAPEILDKKFEVLGMGEKKPTFMDRKFTISVPSALYSVGAFIMMCFFVYIVGTLQEEKLTSQYRQMMNISLSNSTSTINRN